MKRILSLGVFALGTVFFLSLEAAAQELNFDEVKSRTEKAFGKSDLIFMGVTHSVFFPLPQEVKMIADVALKSLETPYDQPAVENDEEEKEQSQSARIIEKIISNFF